ncbi:hypothetical protein VNO78_12206 [Psophocarpus tetragonolobus]|uniref:Uncharacterized protein n=1 Tax=Psophocarpus tetragonolobus TaxID=3891 RepID=A0AAN9XPM9_PSOTE
MLREIWARVWKNNKPADIAMSYWHLLGYLSQRHNHAILENPLIDITKTTFSNYLACMEVIGYQQKTKQWNFQSKVYVGKSRASTGSLSQFIVRNFSKRNEHWQLD